MGGTRLSRGGPRGMLGVPERGTIWLRHVRPHMVGGRGRRFLYRYATRRTCWRRVGPHRECGFDAGGLPARPRTFRVCGTVCWSAPLGGYPRGAASVLLRGMLARRRVEHPWIPFRSECEGMRRDQSSPGRFHENESLPLCPLLGGGAAKGGEKILRGSGRALEKRGRPEPCGRRDEGRDNPDRP